MTALNPKGLIFFVAFVPQFMTASAPFGTQVVIFEATFVLLAATNAALYATTAGSLRGRLGTARLRRTANRTGGALLIGAGLLAAGWRSAQA